MNERLSLLQQHRVISSISAELCGKVAELIVQELHLPVDNEQLQMAITHMARAYDRITMGNPIEHGLDVDLWQDVVRDPAYPKIKNFNERLLFLLQLHEIPATENSFLLSNLLSLYYAAEEIMN